MMHGLYHREIDATRKGKSHGLTQPAGKNYSKKMKRLFNSRISRTLAALLLLSAAVHLLLLAIHSLATLNLQAFNLFDILDLDLFFPDIAEGAASFDLSTAVTLIILLVIWRLTPKSAKKA